MKKICFCLMIGLIIQLHLFSQIGPEKFMINIGGPQIDRTTNLDLWQSDKILVGGHTYSFDDPEDQDAFLNILSTQGELLNSWSISTDARDALTAVISLSDQSFLVSGNTVKNNTNGTTDDWYFLKLNSSGFITMNKSLGNLGNDDQLHYSSLTSDHRIINCGASNFSGNRTGTLALIDTLGGIIWAKVFDPGSSWESFEEVREVEDGFLVVGLSDIITDDDRAVMLCKFDFAGNLLWSRVYENGDLSVSSKHIEVLDDDNIYIIDHILNEDDLDILLIKVNATGGVVWAKSIGSFGSENFRFLAPSNDGNLILGGSTNSFGQDNQNGLVCKINPEGDVLWAHAYGHDGDDYIYNILPFSNDERSGYFMVGSSNSFKMDGDLDGTFTKISEAGFGFLDCFTQSLFLETEDLTGQISVQTLDTDAVEPWIQSTNQEFIITERNISVKEMDCPPMTTSASDVELDNFINIHPNPAVDEVIVKLDGITIDEHAILGLSCINGKKLIEQKLQRAEENIKLDLSPFPNGLYFITVQNSSDRATKKLVIQR